MHMRIMSHLTIRLMYNNLCSWKIKWNAKFSKLEMKCSFTLNDSLKIYLLLFYLCKNIYVWIVFHLFWLLINCQTTWILGFKVLGRFGNQIMCWVDLVSGKILAAIFFWVHTWQRGSCSLGPLFIWALIPFMKALADRHLRIPPKGPTCPEN